MTKAFFAGFRVDVEESWYGAIEFMESALAVLAESRFDYARLDRHGPGEE